MSEKKDGLYFLRYVHAYKTPNSHAVTVWLDGGRVEHCLEANADEGWVRHADGAGNVLTSRGNIRITAHLHALVGHCRRPEVELHPTRLEVSNAEHSMSYEFVSFNKEDAEETFCMLSEGKEPTEVMANAAGRRVALLEKVTYGGGTQSRRRPWWRRVMGL